MLDILIRSPMGTEDVLETVERLDGRRLPSASIVRMTLVPLTVLAILAAWMPAAMAADEAPRIVVLGDSLTSGYGIGTADAYPAVLQARVDDAGYHYQVVNAGVSGDTSGRALRRYRQALDGDVKILIVALGANDGLRGVPVAQLNSNLSVIIEAAQRRDIAVVLVGMDALPLRGWDYSIAFHRVYQDLAARYHLPLVPSVLTKVMPDASLMQSDRAHPNQNGARAIADMIWPYLEPLLGGPKADHDSPVTSPLRRW
jgi:acyl-CoA thioesterase-1